MRMIKIALATAAVLSVAPPAAFAQYQDARRLDVLRLQSAARNSMEWFEEIERYFHLDPVQFTYITRRGSIACCSCADSNCRRVMRVSTTP